MNPERWSQGDMSEFERQLLDAAKQDGVPPALGARMAAGLGVVHAASAAASGTAPASTQSGLAAGGKVGAPLFAKTALWGVLSVALVASIASWHAMQVAPRAHRVLQARGASVQPEPAAAVEQPAAIATKALVRPEPVAAAGTDTPRPLRAHAAASEDDAALRAEVALLDSARRALRDGAHARALRLLDQHRRRFAQARLAPEAAALRIETLVQLGSYEQAQALSQRFATAYPSHPLREHVLKLTAPRANSIAR